MFKSSAFSLALIVSASLGLSACSAGQINGLLPQPSATASPVANPSQGVFANALSRRLLPLNTTNQSTGTNDSAATAPAANPAPQAGAPVAAPTVGQAASGESKLAPDIATGASSRMIAPWFGGGEFNQYVIQFAEESVFSASQAATLLKAYEETVKPILAQWDSSARLIESRANIGVDGNSNFVEYLSLPGQDGKVEQIQPAYFFRFASTPRKETLNIYLLKQETRVHRMVWGEPVIDISQVKIDSSQAQEIASKAFSNPDSSGAYPVYPETVRDPNQKVIAEIPATAQWQIQLNQQGQSQNRYFVSVGFDVVTPVVQASAKPQLDPATTDANMRCYPEEMPRYPEKMQVWGSAEIDAQTGAIKQLNRPVLYLPMYDVPAVRCVAPSVPPEELKPQPVASPSGSEVTTQPAPAVTAVPQ
ncbi:hypothetical protein COW36_01585 [bacterium (Candidatus Blackallbacteria) CG17_big_fil_post_rev_8_21_14_2_50_48_46]|uniref:Uncharacterized protein n=1 Tax=bacterium (Candidatus Blackallbacteria) CG17_big_fil_post_rev_8_21_14_2_50_48_46 TaxID=2014261 RepID=A0A2M7GBL1_9BACT|nr:MAG: hypothetical protein COW64_09590 [bacterium (Candidatus Blackallbacteria) CG18_big_fil_WC_8_21_14_2_50_49_26]PIW19557.1 MAG: hypothetical protein COW36_01585 [bacterium (Candidatus Blackallbacteria) CG17_big_fil_post_rev_8_21_14_2_50_48_46]PIW48840.1 MAG: hypothetical protein COW20_06870 [bacterium (Candidatus Blackallbacteria) CG13_big_fil_rev_8_21_14_2_50_49_14]